MGSTPIHGIPFADPTDLVRDWPALSEDVALAIEAALEDISVPQKRIEAFTGSGTFTVPAGVTYAIAHMLGGGGGTGRAGTGGDGGASSVAFASGTVSSAGGRKMGGMNFPDHDATAGQDNSGRGAKIQVTASTGDAAHFGDITAFDAQYVVAAAAVTPASNITVTVGAGGSAGTAPGAAGGSGYVYIEFFEEV